MKNFNLSRQIAKSLGVATSLEDFDVDVNIGTNPDTEVDENGAQLSPVTSSGELTPEAEQVEVSEEVQETEEIADESEELEEDVEALESIQLILKNSLSQGGLDTVSVEMFNLTMDKILNKHGIASKDLVPSMEDFGDNRYHATQVSMEKVGAALKSFKNGAIDVFKQLWQNLKKMVFKIIQFFKGGVAKRADKLIEKANAAKTNHFIAKEKQIKLYAANKLEINGKVPGLAEITKKYEAAVKAHTKYSANYAKVVADGIEALNAMGGAESATFDFVKAVDNSFASCYNIVHKKLEKAVFDLGLGNAVIAFYPEELKVVLEKNANSASVSRKNGGESQMAEVMSLDQIISTAELVKTSVKSIEPFEKTYNNKSIEQKLLKELEEMYNEVEGEAKTKDEKKERKGYGKRVAKLYKSYLAFGGKLSGYITDTSKAMLDYAAQSMGAYGKNPAA